MANKYENMTNDYLLGCFESIIDDCTTMCVNTKHGEDDLAVEYREMREEILRRMGA